MKRLGLVLLLLGPACGDVEEKAACGGSLDCPAGEWCASAEGEQRCWPDAVAPVASDVTLTCGTTPCLRDGTLRVEATVSDDNEVLSAEATLDLDPARPIPLARSGARWVADVPLRDFPFERFEGPVAARVTGTDGAKTRSVAVDSAAVQVTRLRWEYTAANALTAPAVTLDGTAVMGVATTTDQLLAVRPDGTKAWSLTSGAQGIAAAPTVGLRAIWVGNRDGVLAAAALDGSSLLSGVGTSVGGEIRGSVALKSLVDKEWAFVTSSNGRLAAASTFPGEDDMTGASLPMSLGPVVTRAGRVCGTASTLRCYAFDGAFDLPINSDLPGATGGAPVVDGADEAWLGAGEPGTLVRISSAGQTYPTLTLTSGVFSDSLVVAAGGDVLAADTLSRLHRISSVGAPVWAPPANVGGIANAPLILVGTTSLLVSTLNGKVVALNDQGQLVWETTLLTTDLRAPNIYTPPGQPAGAVLSTAYISSASGKLYAVIVDGELDTSAPWPKAFHDPRNTNNAGTQP